MCVFGVFCNSNSLNKWPENQDRLIDLQCCRASLHICFWGDCSACPHICLGWSDVSERGWQKLVKRSWKALISSSKQCWKGEMGERDPQHIAFVLKTRQAHDVYVRVMYGGFFRCLGPECPGCAGAECTMCPINPIRHVWLHLQKEDDLHLMGGKFKIKPELTFNPEISLIIYQQVKTVYLLS